jgi:hypothetical protein
MVPFEFDGSPSLASLLRMSDFATDHAQSKLATLGLKHQTSNIKH